MILLRLSSRFTLFNKNPAGRPDFKLFFGDVEVHKCDSPFFSHACASYQAIACIPMLSIAAIPITQ